LAKAIGGGAEGAQTALKEHFHKSLTLAEAQKIALQILKDVMEDSITSTNVELATIQLDGIYRPATKQQIQDIIETLTDHINP